MNLEDYIGTLNDHQSYLKLLKRIELDCVYIEIVLIKKILRVLKKQQNSFLKAIFF